MTSILIAAAVGQPRATLRALHRSARRLLGRIRLYWLLRAAARDPSVARLAAFRQASGTQLTATELKAIADQVRLRRPCNFLVFGVGHDSALWAAINRGGRTTFLEDDERWLEQVKKRWKVDARLTRYTTQRSEWKALVNRPDVLSMEIPPDIRDQRWDVILVDAPAGWADEKPGRMQSIYTAVQLASLSDNAATVLVHDCNREVESAYCDRYLGDERLIESVDLLRHYRVEPSQGVRHSRGSARAS